LAIVANEGQGAVDAKLRLTSAADAYGEIVWAWRPGAGVKSCRGESLCRWWWQESRSPGRTRISRKAIAQGRPGVLRWTCMLVGSISFCNTPARPRVQRAPGLPCALWFLGARNSCKPRANHAARMRARICCLKC